MHGLRGQGRVRALSGRERQRVAGGCAARKCGRALGNHFAFGRRRRRRLRVARGDLAAFFVDERAESAGCHARIERSHALLELRMSGEPAGAHLVGPRRIAVREEHVRDVHGAGVLQARAVGVRGHGDECALQCLRIARELHRRSIGEKLTASRHRRL